jgi:hypothetical protein
MWISGIHILDILWLKVLVASHPTFRLGCDWNEAPHRRHRRPRETTPAASSYAMDLPIELPSIFSFPPFFTRQPNEQTYAAQKTAWTNLILSYYRAKRLWRIDVNQETVDKVPIFSNRDIQRTSLYINAHSRQTKTGLPERISGKHGERWTGRMDR